MHRRRIEKGRIPDRILTVLGLAILIAGCSAPLTTREKGALAGGAVGAGAGAAIGSTTGHTGTGALIGAGVGAVSGALIGDALQANEQKQAQPAPPPLAPPAATVPPSVVVFGPEDPTIIKEYYAKGSKGLPPGLAKRERLPPGLQRQLQRNGTLPPGLAKKLEPLPRELEVRLTPLPPGYVRVVVGTDVIILNKTTQKVLDILRDVAVLARDITK